MLTKKKRGFNLAWLDAQVSTYCRCSVLMHPKCRIENELCAWAAFLRSPLTPRELRPAGLLSRGL